ncbi:secreted protein [Rhodopirellula islandica]|uniref:Secreted protein n=1 Tax=Rhodopirellula islandica TaxID=595434 RepID=A0A0J1BGH6_RHOIS|nr:secreted protein [Rhodopirellula islandica]
MWAQEPIEKVPSLKAMTWNIWHGGREDGETVGPQRVAEVIRDSGADLVAMQETYGSGERISNALEFHFHPRGTNVSIHSRYPVIEDISVFEEFKCVGALVELPDGDRVAFYSVWLPYKADIWASHGRDGLDEAHLATQCDVSRDDLQKILGLIDERLKDDQYADTTVLIAGDFNSMSHLDYGEISRDQYGHQVKWPTSMVMKHAGFRDSYREVNPVVSRVKDSTWSPRFIEQEQDRIDFLYYRSQRWRAKSSSVVNEHEDWFPSDHAAVLTEFERGDMAGSDALENIKLKAVAYNIRHGVGVDNELALMRVAKRLHDLKPDLVGLAEVDQNCRRSGNRNQAAELGRALDMHAAFGKFMEHDGGAYGMGILSEHPIVEVTSLDLPPGGEPRIALLAEVLLPNDQRVLVVHVHFDWIDDDEVRFSQASTLQKHLKTVELPIVLLGDFNDQPGSRTLELFQDFVEADKPESANLTWPADHPEIEIDFIFASPPNRWSVGETRVVPESVVSDHRPVISELRLRSE